MSDKPVIQLHTLDQWFQQDPTIRSLILQNIKIKDRLWKHIAANNREPAPTEPFWAPCRTCEKKGWVEVHPRYPGFHPSQIISPCMLKLYNDIVGISGHQKVEPRLQITFDLGHAVHHMFQKYGAQGAWGTHYISEAAVNPETSELAEELMVEGHADADTLMMVDIPESPYLYEVGVVHEYKSINSKNFAKLTRPKPEHQMQALIYSACLNRPVIAYLYLNKDDSNLADFPVEFKPDVWGSVQNKIKTVSDGYKNGIAPKGETGYHCQECPYVNSCFDYREAMVKKQGGEPWPAP